MRYVNSGDCPEYVFGRARRASLGVGRAPATVSERVERLIDRKLVQRTEDRVDQRRSSLRLAPAGLELLRTMHDIVDEPALGEHGRHRHGSSPAQSDQHRRLPRRWAPERVWLF